MTSHLIVNADDFGYAPGVNRGIVEAATAGIVTATGVFANAADLEQLARTLEQTRQLDTGVHLNLTHGEALTSDMRALLGKWNGCFPDKFSLVRMLFQKTMTLSTVEVEWRAQIQRCIDNGIEVRFLNSHEHVHMLPSLFSVAASLADGFEIPHVRFAVADWRGVGNAGAVFRNSLIAIAGRFAVRSTGTKAPAMLGLARSGKLDLPYLEKTLSSLKDQTIYELMCHPGRAAADEIDDPKLLRYHEWDRERRLLCSDAVKNMLGDNGIRLIGYRHLRVIGDRLEVR